MSSWLQQLSKQIVPKRSLFYWLVAIFNRVSKERIKEVGADIACAEWLMRNGAAVKWGDANDYSNNYDILMTINNHSCTNKKFIYGVDATDSGISHEGFPHFDGCNHICDIKLTNCIYIGNEALHKLKYLKNSLKNLEISNCGNITESGLDNLKILTNLELLKLANLPEIKNPDNVINELNKSLPNCQIIYEQK